MRIRQSPLTKLSKNDLIVDNDPLKKSDLNLIITRIEELVSKDIRGKCNSYRIKSNFINAHIYKN